MKAKNYQHTVTGKKFTNALVIAFVLHIGFTTAQQVSTLAGSITAGSADGIGSVASFNSPYGIAADENGNIYVADATNNMIRQIVVSTGEVTTLAGSGKYGSADGVGTAAGFQSPTGVAYDGNGNLYVTDALNNEIRKVIIATGEVSTIAGNTVSGFSDGIGTTASFFSPAGITYDGSGNLYIADKGNNEIRKLVISTGAVTTLAGYVLSGTADGTGASARFKQPTSVTFGNDGNIYVADCGNNEIRKIVPATGAVTTISGSVKSGCADGSGSSAAFNAPTGLTCDGKGNLYVADAHNNEIRKLKLIDNPVTTMAGSVLQGYSNGLVVNATFNSPSGISIDQYGNIYIADLKNNEIRMINNTLTSVNGMNATPYSLSVYPNPSVQNIYLNFTAETTNKSANIKIMDITGKEVMSVNTSIDNSKTQPIDIRNLTEGVYFVQVICAGNSQVAKFYKQ